MQRLDVSGAVRPICGSLGVKGLTTYNRVLAENLMDTQVHNYNSYVLQFSTSEPSSG